MASHGSLGSLGSLGSWIAQKCVDLKRTGSMPENRLKPSPCDYPLVNIQKTIENNHF